MTNAVRDLAAMLARIERRLHALETAPRAPQTSVRGGFTRWQPVDESLENPKVYIGAAGAEDVALTVNGVDDGPGDIFIGTSSGNALVFVRPSAELLCRNPDNVGSALRVVDGKVHAPLIACAWQMDTNVAVDSGGRPTTTSATYVNLWRTFLPCTSGGVYTVVDVYPGVGNTAAVRILASVFSGGVAAQTLVEQTGMTTTTTVEGPWTVPDAVLDPPTSPIGSVLELVIQARRTAGASAIAVAPRVPALNVVT